jgi:hypothetical protein
MAAGYALRMSDEIHDWLTGLRDTDALVANHVVYGLAALMRQGADLESPLVASTEDAWPSALAQELDRRYAEMLEGMARSRREMAGRTADAGALERHSRRQAQTDAFRVTKEVLKARHVAARASLMIHQSLDGPGLAGDDTHQRDGSGESISAAETELRRITAEMERELGQQAWPAGLMELRPGAPGDIGIRILFAVEPPGTALLLSALEGSEAVQDHHGQAIALSADILRRARAGQEPEAASRGYVSPREFMAEFQPRYEAGPEDR